MQIANNNTSLLHYAIHEGYSIMNLSLLLQVYSHQLHELGNKGVVYRMTGLWYLCKLYCEIKLYTITTKGTLPHG